MKYKINIPKGELAISLLCVADSMAISRTTKDCTTASHKQTYDNIHMRLCSTLVLEVELHKLKVSDCDGIEVPPEQLSLGMHIFTKYVKEPNWDEIKKQHPECEVGESGCYDFSGVNLNLGESKPDLILSKLYCYQSTFQQLNEWGKGTHLFVAVEMVSEEVILDLTNSEGVVIENSYYRGHIGYSSAEQEEFKTPIQKPLSKQKFHKDEILRVIRKLGFDPKSKPKWQGGKRGVKADVRDELLSNIFKLSNFNKDNIIENSSCKGYVGYSAEEHEKSKTPIQKPVSKQKFHKDEILRVIRKLGFDPKSIPKWQDGKRGVKADVRDELLSNSFSISSFNHAWDSLRVTDEIKDQKACSP